MMENWTPLNDIWDEYSEKLDSVEESDMAQDLVWPRQLFLGEGEKGDVHNFVAERVKEMVEQAQRERGINLQWIGGLMFKSLVAGMLWERERVGK